MTYNMVIVWILNAGVKGNIRKEQNDVPTWLLTQYFLIKIYLKKNKIQAAQFSRRASHPICINTRSF